MEFGVFVADGAVGREGAAVGAGAEGVEVGDCEGVGGGGEADEETAEECAWGGDWEG